MALNFMNETILSSSKSYVKIDGLREDKQPIIFQYTCLIYSFKKANLSIGSNLNKEIVPCLKLLEKYFLNKHDFSLRIVIA